jgi:hypothetical protein
MVNGLATGASSSRSSLGKQKSGQIYILTGMRIRIIIGNPMAANIRLFEGGTDGLGDRKRRTEAKEFHGNKVVDGFEST